MNSFTQTRKPRADRHPAISYDEILDLDSRTVPDSLREYHTPFIPSGTIPVANYLDPAYFADEVKYLWPRVWQVVCREEEIPNSADFVLYENVGMSLIISRQADSSIKALHNSCLHRGRRLVTEKGCKARFTCPYHGLTWKNDGTSHANPIAFDFPQWTDGTPPLPEARVERWGGWVFINCDPDAPSLDSVLGPMVGHFERWEPEKRYIALHVRKIVPCNWKLTAEAFMESHHAPTTHPQILPYMTDVNSQYDSLTDDVTRQFSAQLIPSPFAGRHYEEEEIVSTMLGVGSRLKGAVGDAAMAIPEGSTARQHVSQIMRGILNAEDGFDYDSFADAEMVDALLYNVFPHLSFWGGAMPSLNYVWRPNGLDPTTSIMDVYMLRRSPASGRPAPAQRTDVPITESFTEASERSGMSPGLAKILDQDMTNLPEVQRGIMASATGVVEMGAYTEMRLRHLHAKIDATIAEGKAAAAAKAVAAKTGG